MAEVGTVGASALSSKIKLVTHAALTTLVVVGPVLAVAIGILLLWGRAVHLRDETPDVSMAPLTPSRSAYLHAEVVSTRPRPTADIRANRLLEKPTSRLEPPASRVISGILVCPRKQHGRPRRPIVEVPKRRITCSNTR